MGNVPHMILPWIFDIPNQTLTCKINNNLMYISLQGGVLGFTKIYNGVETHVPIDDWIDEKQWISNNYSDIVGTFQFDESRIINAHDPNNPDRMIPAPQGVDENGYYLDHMQRPQQLMEGEDCARIAFGFSGTQYQTPDLGLTVYKRVQTSDTLYNDNDVPGDTFLEHSQPCMMQPRTPGARVSSHEEMLADGIDVKIVKQCQAGEWATPLRPDLQKYYIYPTK